MHEFEKLGVFYLGRSKSDGGLLLYESRHLMTHAVCVGMTGSGKTGLCVGLLEEAAIDNIPALIIDPKGDLSNLLLTFPELRAEDLTPWVNEDEARRKGMSRTDLAREHAERWRNGIAQWGQDTSRIRRVRDAVDWTIYTPGSESGVPVSVVSSFAAPPPQLIEDPEALRDRVNGTATALLALAGIESDPIQSREHILLATILDAAWKQGRDLDLAQIIQQIQTPPVSRIGVLDLDAFFPSKDRFGLAMALNNLLASPGFEAWLHGEPLDVGRMLYTESGKPRHSIFSIAHLGDTERMFFVSLLLNQTLGWMRAQSGTTSLRALLYMDEIFGYFPPVRNPPTKQPLLTLLKQARAFGLGVVLATQNPVDLDYKGLSNCGTWFIGRLQTERDKMRVIEGLEGAAADSGTRFDRGRMEEILSSLGNRVFLMNNVHEDAPEVFETRWTLSYLAGPITRAQIKTLMEPRKASGAVAPSATAARSVVSHGSAGARPVLPTEIRQHFLPVRGGRPVGSSLVYQPYVLGAAQIRFADAKTRVDISNDLTFLAEVTSAPVPVQWEEAAGVPVDPTDLEDAPAEDAGFLDLPGPASRPKAYAAWQREFANWLFATQKVETYRSPSLKEFSKPGESERDFRIRLQGAAHERRDAVVDKLRAKYAPKQAALQERLRRAHQAREKEAQQASEQKLSAVFSIGTSLLEGLFTGRKAVSKRTISAASGAARSVGRIRREAGDVARAEENVEALEQQIQDLNAQIEAEVNSLGLSIDPSTEELEAIAIRPKKTGITVRLLTLAWAPVWRDESGAVTPAWE